MKFRLLLLLTLLVSAACSSVEPDVEAVAPTADGAQALSGLATAGIEYGRNENGTFYQGAADAPVTLTDYSDFL